MKIRVLFTISTTPVPLRDVVEVNDVNDDREIKKALQAKVDELITNAKVKSIVMVEQIG